MIITIQLIISRRTKLAVANFQKCSMNYLYMHYIDYDKFTENEDNDINGV